MNVREICQSLREGRRVYSTQFTAPAPWWPRAMKRLGIDFVFVDTEHVPHDRHLLSWICQTFSALDLPPVVRIPCPDPFEACKALDGGAAGIIAPYIESPEQVRHMVGATRLRPLKGGRLSAALADDQKLERTLQDYLNRRNADTILILNIESVPAEPSIRKRAMAALFSKTSPQRVAVIQQRLPSGQKRRICAASSPAIAGLIRFV